MGQVGDKKLSAEHSKLFIDWCSELRETKTLTNRLYFENGCSNLRLHVFTDASENAVWIGTYLQNEVRPACRALRSSSQKADLPPTRIKLLLDRLINCYAVHTSSAQETTSVCCEQSCGNTGKFIDGSMGKRQGCWKPCQHRNPRNVHRRPEGVKVTKWASMAIT